MIGTCAFVKVTYDVVSARSVTRPQKCAFKWLAHLDAVIQPASRPDQESATTDTRAFVEEAVHLPEKMPGGHLLTQQQELEHQLQESRSEQSGDSIRTAAVLHKLGQVLAQTGDLKQAMRYLQESLQMQRSLHGDGDHPGIAVTLHELGDV